MNFEWDADKAAANVKKHKVTFEEASTAFDDPLFLTFADSDHSLEERRFILMAESKAGKLLVVSFTNREIDSIRIISARKATPSERRFYEEEG